MSLFPPPPPPTDVLSPGCKAGHFSSFPFAPSYFYPRSPTSAFPLFVHIQTWGHVCLGPFLFGCPPPPTPDPRGPPFFSSFFSDLKAFCPMLGFDSVYTNVPLFFPVFSVSYSPLPFPSLSFASAPLRPSLSLKHVPPLKLPFSPQHLIVLTLPVFFFFPFLSAKIAFFPSLESFWIPSPFFWDHPSKWFPLLFLLPRVGSRFLFFFLFF